jgi:hypothetical protein
MSQSKKHRTQKRRMGRPAYGDICLLAGIWHYASMGKKKPKKKSPKTHTKKKTAPKRRVSQIALHVAEKVTKGQVLL